MGLAFYLRRDDVHPASGGDRANGDTHEEVTPMWSKLFGGGDGLPHEKVDTVVHVIHRYLQRRPSSAGFRARTKAFIPETFLPISAGR
jgi:hypothetical protein